MIRLSAPLVCGDGRGLVLLTGAYNLAHWSEDGNRRPCFADEQLASENDNCLEDFACALFAFLLVVVGCLRNPQPEKGLGGCVMGRNGWLRKPEP